MSDPKTLIDNGRAVLGLELGSTRIKAVLIDGEYRPIASGSFQWENRLQNGYWTYDLTEVQRGLRECFADLQREVGEKYGTKIRSLRSMGISGMMHGYLAFNKAGELLVPFRTWRNTTTGPAAEELSGLFRFNIPMRWTIAHLRQAMLSGEPHVKELDMVTTLAGYVHFLLTGERVVGIGEASGIMPVDSRTRDYDEDMVRKFDERTASEGFRKGLRDLFPKVLSAGEKAGCLTEAGARFLDPSGTLLPGIPICPPEGDAGTGMAATNSVAQRTGNVSAGTSIFSMVVLEKALSDYYEEIDMVTTPDGAPVAMVHCNNCTSDINAWAGLLRENLKLFGTEVTTDELYEKLFRAALSGAPDCGGLLSCNYTSGEAIAGFTSGRPFFVRTEEAELNLGNFMRSHLYAALVTLKLGNDILRKKENVTIDTLYGHGGYFKTRGVGQQFLADALDAPVSVMETAGEGGPWGMALLAAFASEKTEKETLPEFLNEKVFRGSKGETLYPDPAGVRGFNTYTEGFSRALAMERAAVESIG